MIVKIEHPNHGQMHVYSQFDLDRHLEWGWRVMDDTPKGESKTKKNDSNIVQIKRGRRLGTRRANE